MKANESAFCFIYSNPGFEKIAVSRYVSYIKSPIVQRAHGKVIDHMRMSINKGKKKKNTAVMNRTM